MSSEYNMCVYNMQKQIIKFPSIVDSSYFYNIFLKGLLDVTFFFFYVLEATQNHP